MKETTTTAGGKCDGAVARVGAGMISSLVLALTREGMIDFAICLIDLVEDLRLNSTRFVELKSEPMQNSILTHAG